MVRRLAVENFANRAHTLIFQRVAHTLQDGKRRARVKLAQLAGDIDRWENLTRSTDYVEAAA